MITFMIALFCTIANYCSQLKYLNYPLSLSKKFNDFVLTKSAFRVRTYNITLVQPSKYNINKYAVFLSVV